MNTQKAVTRRQVITVGLDGSLQGLQHKPGLGLDLRQFGAAQIVRASEVTWNQDIQMWVVEFRDGPCKGELLDQDHVRAAGLDVANPGFRHTPFWEVFERDGADGGVLAFPDYDEAVKAEVAVLDGLRLNGIY